MQDTAVSPLKVVKEGVPQLGVGGETGSAYEVAHRQLFGGETPDIGAVRHGGKPEELVTKQFEQSEMGKRAEEAIALRLHQVADRCLGENGLKDNVSDLDALLVTIVQKMGRVKGRLTRDTLPTYSLLKLSNLSWSEIDGLLYALETYERQCEGLMGVRQKETGVRPESESRSLGEFLSDAIWLPTGEDVRMREVEKRFNAHYEVSDKYNPKQLSEGMKEFSKLSKDRQMEELWRIRTGKRSLLYYLSGQTGWGDYHYGSMTDSPALREEIEKVLQDTKYRDTAVEPSTIRSAEIQAGVNLVKREAGSLWRDAMEMFTERKAVKVGETYKLVDIETFENVAVGAAKKKVKPEEEGQRTQAQTAFESAQNDYKKAQAAVETAKRKKTTLPAEIARLTKQSEDTAAKLSGATEASVPFLTDLLKEINKNLIAKQREFDDIDDTTAQKEFELGQKKQAMDDAEKKFKSYGETGLNPDFRQAILDLHEIVKEGGIKGDLLARLSVESLSLSPDMDQNMRAIRTMLGLGKSFDRALGVMIDGKCDYRYFYKFLIQTLGIPGTDIKKLEVAFQAQPRQGGQPATPPAGAPVYRTGEQQALIYEAQGRIIDALQTADEGRLVDLADASWRALMESSDVNIQSSYGMRIDYAIEGEMVRVASEFQSSEARVEKMGSDPFVEVLRQKGYLVGVDSVVRYAALRNGERVAITADKETGVNVVLNAKGDILGNLERRVGTGPIQPTVEIPGWSLREWQSEIFEYLALDQIQIEFDRQTASSFSLNKIIGGVGGEKVVRGANGEYFVGTKPWREYVREKYRAMLDAKARTAVQEVEETNKLLREEIKETGQLEVLSSGDRSYMRWRARDAQPTDPLYNEIDVDLLRDKPRFIYTAPHTNVLNFPWPGMARRLVNLGPLGAHSIPLPNFTTKSVNWTIMESVGEIGIDYTAFAGLPLLLKNLFLHERANLLGSVYLDMIKTKGKIIGLEDYFKPIRYQGYEFRLDMQGNLIAMIDNQPRDAMEVLNRDIVAGKLDVKKYTSIWRKLGNGYLHALYDLNHR